MFERVKVRKIIMLILPMIALMAAPTNYVQGKKLYFSKGCNNCHGVSATGSGQYPSLAYRRKAFLTYRIKALRAKQKTSQLSELMIPFALGLSDIEIDALSTFLNEYHENKSTYSPDDSMTGGGSS